MLEIEQPSHKTGNRTETIEKYIETIKTQIPKKLQIDYYRRNYSLYIKLLDNIGGKLPSNYFYDFLPQEEL